ncbi:MAG TPA: hypothetical protein VGK82_09180 [Pyrinomonadaceae bacterium]
MSFDLAVMNLETPVSSEAAAEIYGELCEGNYDVLGPSEKIDAFYRELVEKYPDINSYSDDTVDNCPWSVEIDVSDGAVLMCLVWSRVEEVAPFVMGLAERHQLACYDPQDDKLYLPRSV